MIGWALALVGVAGVPDDLRGWGEWLGAIDSDAGRWSLVIAGLVLALGTHFWPRPRARGTTTRDAVAGPAPDPAEAGEFAQTLQPTRPADALLGASRRLRDRDALIRERANGEQLRGRIIADRHTLLVSRQYEYDVTAWQNRVLTLLQRYPGLTEQFLAPVPLTGLATTATALGYRPNDSERLVRQMDSRLLRLTEILSANPELPNPQWLN